MKIKYSNQNEHQLLLIKATGLITKTDLLNFIHHLLVQSEVFSINKVLFDSCECSYGLTIDEIKDFARSRILERLMKTYSSSMVIILTSKPKETALILFFSRLLTQNLIHIEVCSTLEKARQKLALPVSITVLNELLNNLVFDFSK